MQKDREPYTREDGDALSTLEQLRALRKGPDKEPSTVELLRTSVDMLEEVELLSQVLRTHSKQSGSPLQQARILLDHFGNLRGLARAGVAELTALGGITPAKAAALHAAFELGLRLCSRPFSRGEVYTSSREVYDAFGPRLSQLEQETFWVLLMDQRNRVLKQLQIAKGSINRCPVMPQDIFAPALREKAVRMVLLHNHPSGDPEPSTDDRSLTRRLQHLAELHNIELLDHIVVGELRYVSFADRGWL